MKTLELKSIDVWLEEASKASYAIEKRWSAQHSHALIERLHEAITAPRQADMDTLARRCSVAERNALSYPNPPADMEATSERIQAIAQLGMAARLLEVLGCKSQGRAIEDAVRDEDNAKIVGALDGLDDGLTMAQLSGIDGRDVFTLRRHLQALTTSGVLRSWGGSDGTPVRYALSMQAVETLDLPQG